MNDHMMRELSRQKVEAWRSEAMASQRARAGRRTRSISFLASLKRRSRRARRSLVTHRRLIVVHHR